LRGYPWREPGLTARRQARESRDDGSRAEVKQYIRQRRAGKARVNSAAE